MGSIALQKMLKDDGWKLVGSKGSHQQYKHPTKKGKVTLPSPVKDYPPGTIKSILKQAGLNN